MRAARLLLLLSLSAGAACTLVRDLSYLKPGEAGDGVAPDAHGDSGTVGPGGAPNEDAGASDADSAVADAGADAPHVDGGCQQFEHSPTIVEGTAIGVLPAIASKDGNCTQTETNNNDDFVVFRGFGFQVPASLRATHVNVTMSRIAAPGAVTAVDQGLDLLVGGATLTRPGASWAEGACTDSILQEVTASFDVSSTASAVNAAEFAVRLRYSTGAQGQQRKFFFDIVTVAVTACE